MLGKLLFLWLLSKAGKGAAPGGGGGGASPTPPAAPAITPPPPPPPPPPAGSTSSAPDGVLLAVYYLNSQLPGSPWQLAVGGWITTAQAAAFAGSSHLALGSWAYSETIDPTKMFWIDVFNQTSVASVNR